MCRIAFLSAVIMLEQSMRASDLWAFQVKGARTKTQQIEMDGKEREAAAALPPVLLRAFSEGLVFDAEGDQLPLHSNVSVGDAMVLYRAVHETKLSTTAEVGFAQGISTLAILKALADNQSGIHHVIDPFQAQYNDIGLAMVERAGLGSRMYFHRKFAEEVVPHLAALDFGFIDSSHRFDATICEFVLLDRKLKIGGKLAFHDMRLPSMQKFLRYVFANRSYELVRTFDSSSSTKPRGKNWTPRNFLMWASSLVPGKGRIFRDEVLQPWDSMDIPSLAVLRKTASDDGELMFNSHF